MLNLLDGMTLYHGSYCEIAYPDLEKCAPYKDFGKGFYLTASYEQARKFISTSLKKAKSQKLIDANQTYGVISTFKFKATDSLKIKIYEEANSEWLHCIVAHRKNKTFPEIVEKLKSYEFAIDLLTTLVVEEISDKEPMFVLCMSSFFLRKIRILVPIQILTNTSNPKDLSL